MDTDRTWEEEIDSLISDIYGWKKIGAGEYSRRSKECSFIEFRFVYTSARSWHISYKHDGGRWVEIGYADSQSKADIIALAFDFAGAYAECHDLLYDNKIHDIKVVDGVKRLLKERGNGH